MILLFGGGGSSGRCFSKERERKKSTLHTYRGEVVSLV